MDGEIGDLGAFLQKNLSGSRSLERRKIRLMKTKCSFWIPYPLIIHLHIASVQSPVYIAGQHEITICLIFHISTVLLFHFRFWPHFAIFANGVGLEV